MSRMIKTQIFCYTEEGKKNIITLALTCQSNDSKNEQTFYRLLKKQKTLTGPTLKIIVHKQSRMRPRQVTITY
jgi:hypothetical protein